MTLHENISLFRDAIRFTAEQMNLPPEYVEKDYWVTYMLYTIFHNRLGKETVFKGGTALSKCFSIIERFSEDIDLVVMRKEGESNSSLTTKIRAISTLVGDVLPEVVIVGVTNKRGMNRKTAHTYNKEFKGAYGHVRDVIVVESTWLGYYEPNTTQKLVSFIGDMMLRNGQREIAETHRLMPFDVCVLEPTRTLCEKIMSLVRFSYTESPIEDLKKKIRHTYDLHCLLLQKEFAVFFDSSAFDSMLLKVASDDVVSFRNNNKWLAHHPCEALLFKDLENVWNELKTSYNGDFRNLVYGYFPRDTEIVSTLKMIRKRLYGISWSIKIESKK